MQEIKNTYHVIGLMSGTSLDGLDICYVKFNISTENLWTFKILAAETIPYGVEWIHNLRFKEGLSAEELLIKNKDLGFYFGSCVNDFITNHNINRKAVDLISSHGHTLYHQPQKGYTLQIGNGQAIALKTKLPTVYDFRTADVLNGGQGAPLVPIGDEILFGQYEACLNLGGFCNISFEKDNKRMAFDISFCNLVLNRLAERLGHAFDKGGEIASKGPINHEVLNRLNNLNFYKSEGPKSLGAEWLENVVMPLIENLESTSALATCTEHIAIQIAEILSKNDINTTLVTGGGAHNTYLMQRLQSLCKSTIIKGQHDLIDFKESIVFALLGCLRIRNQINVLSSVTGGQSNLCSGVIANP